jgi:ribosomal protein S27AE
VNCSPGLRANPKQRPLPLLLPWNSIQGSSARGKTHMATLPVAPGLDVLASKTYVRTTHRWVALCVISSEFGNRLKFYKWKWREDEQCWKVDLARFSVADIDLCRVAVDAIDLARQYNIALQWNTLHQMQDIGVTVQTSPPCPECGETQTDTLQTVTRWYCGECGHCWDTQIED